MKGQKRSVNVGRHRCRVGQVTCSRGAPSDRCTSSPAQDTPEADAHMDVMAEFGSTECVDIANIGAAASDDSEGEE